MGKKTWTIARTEKNTHKINIPDVIPLGFFFITICCVLCIFRWRLNRRYSVQANKIFIVATHSHTNLCSRLTFLLVILLCVPIPVCQYSSMAETRMRMVLIGIIVIGLSVVCLCVVRRVPVHDSWLCMVVRVWAWIASRRRIAIGPTCRHPSRMVDDDWVRGQSGNVIVWMGAIQPVRLCMWMPLSVSAMNERTQCVCQYAKVKHCMISSMEWSAQCVYRDYTCSNECMGVWVCVSVCVCAVTLRNVLLHRQQYETATTPIQQQRKNCNRFKAILCWFWYFVLALSFPCFMAAFFFSFRVFLSPFRFISCFSLSLFLLSFLVF